MTWNRPRPGTSHRAAFLGPEQRPPADDLARPQDRVLERVRLLLAGEELLAQPLVDGPLRPEDMHAAVRGQPQIAGVDPAAGLVPAGNFHPRMELAGRDVVGPGVEQPAEVVVPLLARQLQLVVPPLLVGLFDVADAAEVDRRPRIGHVRVADADGLGLVVLGSPRPDELALGRPAAVAIPEGPLGVRVADVLEEDQRCRKADRRRSCGRSAR